METSKVIHFGPVDTNLSTYVFADFPQPVKIERIQISHATETNLTPAVFIRYGKTNGTEVLWNSSIETDGVYSWEPSVNYWVERRDSLVITNSNTNAFSTKIYFGK